MKLREICGGAFSLKFDKEIEIEKIANLFKDYKVVIKNEDSIKLSKKEKEILIFKYGEILFYNFKKDEIFEILEIIKNV
ncbi:MAG: hypothetical protein QW678_02920 [Candidatus Aenigmatarchaeota archaeon]